jgi:hypothetical protein
LFINLSWITSDRIKKRAGKKCVYNPVDLEATLPEFQGGTAKKTAENKYDIRRSTFQF